MISFSRRNAAGIVPKPAFAATGYTISLITAAALVVLAPLVAYTRLMLFSFYVRGSYLLDSGLFAHLLWHSDFALTQPASAGGGSYFAVHFTPLFLPIAMLSRLLPLSMPQFFAVFIGASQMLLGVAVFWMILSGDTRRQAATPWIAALAGLGFAFSELAIDIARYPHPETLIPAFFLLFITALERGLLRLAIVFFICGLLVREDAGLHYLTVLGLMVALGARLGDRLLLIRFAVAGLIYAATAMAAQRILFPAHASSFALVYLGNPPLVHLTLPTVLHRVLYFILNRPYVVFPACFVLLWARIARAPFLAIGYLACLPWLGLQLLAASPFAAAVASYYAFPCLIGLAWPLLGAIGRRAGAIGQPRLLLGFAAGILLTFLPAGDIHDPGRLSVPADFWRPLPSASDQARIERAVAAISAARPALGRLFADNSVVALDPGGFARQELEVTPGMGNGSVTMADTVVFFTDGYDAPHLRTVADTAGLSNRYVVAGTPLHLASRLDLTGVQGLRGMIVAE